MKLRYNDVRLEFPNKETIGEVVEQLEELFPNGKWSEFEVVGVSEQCCGNCKCQKNKNTSYSIPFTGSVLNQDG